MQQSVMMRRETGNVASSQQQNRNPKPLLTVLAWELRRHAMRRVMRILLVAAAAFYWLALFVTNPFNPATSKYDEIIAMSAFVLFFQMFVPLVVADRVVRDYNLRMHELLMTTALPTWAYIWGRFLAGLCICLAMPLPCLGVYLLIGLFAPTGYLVPNLGLWLLLIVPSIVAASGLSFSLSTLLPKLSGVFKVSILIVWVIVCVIESFNFKSPWVTAQLQWELAHNQFNLFSWVWPRMLWMLGGLASVGLITLLFKRFSNVLK